jgi:hypothetical protein
MKLLFVQFWHLQGSILQLNSQLANATKELACASKIHGTGRHLAIKYYIYKTDALKNVAVFRAILQVNIGLSYIVGFVSIS